MFIVEFNISEGCLKLQQQTYVVILSAIMTPRNMSLNVCCKSGWLSCYCAHANFPNPEEFQAWIICI